MAATATLFTPPPKAFPFIGVGVPAAQLITPIPSAEVVYSVVLGAITISAGGESQELLVNCVLPQSFCYVLAELSCQISGADADSWLQFANVTLQDSQSAPSYSIPVALENGGAFGVFTSFRTYVASNVPTKLVVPGTGAVAADDGLLSVFIEQPSIDKAAGTFAFYARFLRYDRNQSQYWQVNTPVLTR